MNISLLPDFSAIAAPVAQVLGNLASLAGQQVGDSDSVIKYSAPCRIEPVTIVDGSLAQFEEIHGIMRAVNSVIAAYYFQAIARGINTESAILLRTIDQLRPNRNLLEAVGQFSESSVNEYYGDKKSIEMRTREKISGAVQGIASEAMALPDPNRPGTLSNFLDMSSMVTEGVDSGTVKKMADEETKKLAAKGNMSGNVKVGDDKMMDAPNLAVGKIFEVTAKFGENSVTLPVVVALNTLLSTPSNLIDIYSIGAGRKGFTERLRLVQAGELRFWADFVGMQDLIEEHKRTAIRDNTGTYTANRERDAKNRITAILTGKASIGTASNIAVLNSKTVRKLEAALGGKIAHYEIRQKMFQRTFLSMFLEVDTEWKQVTLYHRGIPDGTTLPIAEFVRAKSKPGSDVSDLVNMFLAGKQLSL